jgi:hypothetical protein
LPKHQTTKIWFQGILGIKANVQMKDGDLNMVIDKILSIWIFAKPKGG